MNPQNERNVSRMRDHYNSDRDVSADRNGNPLSVTWGEYRLLEIVEEQQKQINMLETQVARLLDAVPSAGQSPGGAS